MNKLYLGILILLSLIVIGFGIKYYIIANYSISDSTNVGNKIVMRLKNNLLYIFYFLLLKNKKTIYNIQTDLNLYKFQNSLDPDYHHLSFQKVLIHEQLVPESYTYSNP